MRYLVLGYVGYSRGVPMVVLDISAFANAVQSLHEALVAYKQGPNDFIRDACIQRFEYTYDLAYRMLRRQVERMVGGSDEVDQMTFPVLIRTGAEKGLLLNSWDVWKLHRDARNITSHAYNERKAQSVFEDIPSFYEEAVYLRDQLKKYNGS